MGEPELPQVFLPEGGLSVRAPDGRSLVFLRVPQLEVELKQVLAGQPDEFTYRWAYHPGYRLHVLFVYWPVQGGIQIGVGIPEGPGDGILAAMEGESDIYLTLEPLPEHQETFEGEDLGKVVAGMTVPLAGVRFSRRFGGSAGGESS
ncbi:hypothetical protein [Caldinitratiruptor microaerophilus]|uniref:Uncharacterized protein n=1 Tax=Caldinitratiruptor microaerophilus TaxID=671077 RepID=A0AA35CN92_9FIRM|nr:hypothetical protein [Caldinitratiruptor microaerophilus]BDG62312.1 hypothetical protein caldi_34020 [Caldinitratiruptor microaerophilus]